MVNFYKSEPRLMEDKILSYISGKSEYRIELQNSTGKYMRLKVMPTPSDEILNELENKLGLEVAVYTDNQNNNSILEISMPLFDVICIRDTTKFPDLNGWILQVIHNPQYISDGRVEVIATLKYDEDHPYSLHIAQHLTEYLNENKDTLANMDYEEIYTIV